MPFYPLKFVGVVSLGEKIKNYFSRSREKHKLTFIDDSNYQEKWSFRVSSFNLFSLLGLYTIIILIGTLLLVRYTPLQSLFSSNNAYENESKIDENTELIDSLYKKTEATQMYLDNLKVILNDGSFEDSTGNNLADSLDNFTPDFSKDESDSILRLKVENEYSNNRMNPENETYEFFFAPVNGIVSQSFDKAGKHYGVDVVTREDEPIKSCLEGTVVLTGWIQSEGKIVVIQHKDDLISVYKHCSAILKKSGDQVQTGDPIGIVGNSGENTSGPHLHFELWKKGHQMDPEEYISF